MRETHVVFFLSFFSGENGGGWMDFFSFVLLGEYVSPGLYT